MAINPLTQYPGKVGASTPQYPFGVAQNVSLAGDGTGTPWEQALVNDLFGFQQSLLTAAGTAPSGTPDQVGASQYLQAIAAFAGAEYATVAAMQAAAVLLKDGTQVKVSERVGAVYTVEPSTYTPKEGDITLASGKYARLRVEPYVDPSFFGDVSGDMSALLNSAVTRAREELADTGARSEILITPGQYTLASTVKIDVNYLTIIAFGVTLTRSDGAFGDGLVFESADPATTSILGIRVYGLRMDSTVAMTAGAHMRVTEAANCVFSNISLQNGHIGLHVQGARATYFNTLHIRSGVLYGSVQAGSRFCLIEDSPRPDPVGENTEVFFSDFNMTTNGPNAYVEYGLEVKEADGIWFSNGHLRGASSANAFINGGGAPQLLGLLFQQVWFDGLTERCLRMSGNSAGFFGGIDFSNCWFTGASIHAVHIDAGGNLDNVTFNSPYTWEVDSQQAWNIQSGNHIFLDNPRFRTINNSDVAAASMVNVGSAVQSFTSNGGGVDNSFNINYGFNIRGTTQTTINGFAFKGCNDSCVTINLADTGSTVFDSAGCTTDQPSGYVTGNTQRGEFLNLANDTAASVELGEVLGGLLSFGLKLNTLFTGFVAIETLSPETISKVAGSADLEVTTGPLTGATGNPGKLTVSVGAGGTLYVENRTGTSRSVVWRMLNRDLVN